MIDEIIFNIMWFFKLHYLKKITYWFETICYVNYMFELYDFIM